MGIRMKSNKFKNILLSMLLLVAQLFVINSAFAQTNDSTSMPWTSAGAAYIYNGSTPAGSRCGSGTSGSAWWDWNYAACQGHNPAWSCPGAHYRALVAEQDGVYYFSCIRY